MEAKHLFLFVLLSFFSFSAFSQTQEPKLTITTFEINGKKIVNEEKTPHVQSIEILPLDENIIRLYAEVQGGEKMYGAFLIDLNGNGTFEQNEFVTAFPSVENGVFKQEFKLTDRQWAILKRSKKPIAVQFRVSENRELLYSKEFAPEGTATMSFATSGPIVIVDLGEGDQHPGVDCTQPTDSFVSFVVHNLSAQYEMVVDTIFITNMGSGYSIVPSPLVYIPNVSGNYEEFKINFDVSLEEIFPESKRCFRIPIEMKYRLFEVQILQDKEGEYYYDTTYFKQQVIQDVFEFCYCEKIKENPNDGKDGFLSNDRSRLYHGNSIMISTELITFPNPIQGDFHVQYALEKPASPVISISGINGANAQILLRQTNQEAGVYLYQVDISHLPTGIYLLTLSTEDKIQTQKIVKR